ncbi:hypothetical protein GCM10023238_13230 [Streptomyces heliomycini]
MRDVDGTWRTDRVRERDGRDLTRQVRAIARVATAVTRGDLNLKIDVDASGEIQELQDYINKMIANLRAHHDRQQGAGLAQGQSRPHLGAVAGAPRPGGRGVADHERA